MTYNAEIHHRRSIRLRNYDYSQAGAYFVTVCTWGKECVLIVSRIFRTFIRCLVLVSHCLKPLPAPWLAPRSDPSSDIA